MEKGNTLTSISVPSIPALPSQNRWAGLIWHEFARFFQIIMETTWISLWVYAPLSRHASFGFWSLFLVLAVVCLTSYLLALLINLRKFTFPVGKTVYLAWMFLLGWGIQKILLYPDSPFRFVDVFILPYRELIRLNDIPPNFWLLIVGLVAVLRGVLLARHHAGILSVRGSFRVALIFLLLYGILESNPLLPSFHLPSIVILGSGLIALCCTRLAEMTRQKGGRLLDLRARWFFLVITVVSAVLILAAALDGLIAWQIIPIREILVFILAALITLGVLPFVLIGLSLAYLLLPVINFILRQLVSVFQQWKLPVSQISRDIPPVQFLNRVIDLKPVMVIGITAGILLVILILVGVNRRARNEYASTRFDTDLVNVRWLDDQKDWFKRRLGQTWEFINRRLQWSEARRLWASARIRWVYYRLMQLMAALGNPRPKSVTPLEFLITLNQLIPDVSGDLSEITNAYLLVRYGEVPENEADVRRILLAWERVQKAGQAQIKRKADPKVR